VYYYVLLGTVIVYIVYLCIHFLRVWSARRGLSFFPKRMRRVPVVLPLTGWGGGDWVSNSDHPGGGGRRIRVAFSDDVPASFLLAL